MLWKKHISAQICLKRSRTSIAALLRVGFAAGFAAATSTNSFPSACLSRFLQAKKLCLPSPRFRQKHADRLPARGLLGNEPLALLTYPSPTLFLGSSHEIAISRSRQQVGVGISLTPYHLKTFKPRRHSWLYDPLLRVLCLVHHAVR